MTSHAAEENTAGIPMATLKRHEPRRGKVSLRAGVGCCMIALTLILWVQTRLLYSYKSNLNNIKEAAPSSTSSIDSKHLKKTADRPAIKISQHSACPIASISDLSDAELNPQAGDRHMVTPPSGGKVSLLCCQTTKGDMNILLHEQWAPVGVARFLQMVSTDYFSSQVPLFRCTDACQFGLAGDPNMTRQYKTRLPDDPMWLPPGPEHRHNQHGVKRYPPGVLTYAGGGKNTRANQFVLTLKPNQFMGGGSPWEVPMGELVGKQSFETMSKFYNGYGEKGPSQALLHKEGASDYVRTEWPLMDYITGCHLVEETVMKSSA